MKTKNDLSAVEQGIVTVMAKLKQSSVRLNGISDRLGKAIGRIDDTLKALNLGVACWVRVSVSENSYSRDLGYSKVDGRWGLVVKSYRGTRETNDYQEEVWLINDAPRYMRVEMIGHVPVLLEALVKQADEMAQEVERRIELVNVIAETMREASLEKYEKDARSS